jgi:hypothetical protein
MHRQVYSTTQAVRRACRASNAVKRHRSYMQARRAEVNISVSPSRQRIGVNSEPRNKERGAVLLHSSLYGVLDVFVLFDLDVFDVTGDLLNFANIDRVDYVAGFRID